MSGMKDLFQAADWKTEKHVPVIDAPESINKGGGGYCYGNGR
jgi:desulfoferrodoxin (superoxide reductase-like protein)